MRDFHDLIKNYPRLWDWYQIGPVQAAELESLMLDYIAQNVQALTSDGVSVEPGDQVWVFDGVGNIVPTKVQPNRPTTSYHLFGPVLVEHSFSSEQAAQLYRRHRK